MIKCSHCKNSLEEHTLDEIKECYYKSKMKGGA